METEYETVVGDTGGGLSSEPNRPKKSNARAPSTPAKRLAPAASAAMNATPKRSGRFCEPRLINANAFSPDELWPNWPTGALHGRDRSSRQS